VEARELILRPLTYVRGERSNRARIVVFQLRKCLQIALCRRIFVLAHLQRLVCTKSFRFPSQYEIPDRSPSEMLRLRSEVCTQDQALMEALEAALRQKES
jgi:hypothetical protein